MQDPLRYPIDLEDLRAAYDVFVREGCLNDENSGFGTTFFKGRLDELEQGFRSLGYDGRALERGGRYFDDNGQVLWVYDPDRLSADQAYAKTKAWVMKAPQNRVAKEAAGAFAALVTATRGPSLYSAYASPSPFESGPCPVTID